MSDHPFENAPACTPSFEDSARRPTSAEVIDEQALQNEAALIEKATERAAKQGITTRDIPLAAYVYNMLG